MLTGNPREFAGKYRIVSIGFANDGDDLTYTLRRNGVTTTKDISMRMLDVLGSVGKNVSDPEGSLNFGSGCDLATAISRASSLLATLILEVKQDRDLKTVTIREGDENDFREIDGPPTEPTYRR